MKHCLKKFGLLLFSIMSLMLFFSCEEEDFLREQASETETEPTVVATENPLIVRKVSQADIPNVLSKIKGKMSSAAKFYDNKMVQDDIQIFLDQVKEAVKKGQHSNYTFPIHVEGAPLTDLYVLGIDKNLDGSIGEPIVTKYELSQESYDYFIEENNGIIDFRYFKADYSYYTFDEFFSKKANKSPDCQGTMGAGPGYYPTTEPGGTITNNTTVTGITVGFSNTVIHTSTYVYTVSTPSNTNGQTSSVSTLASSNSIVTTTTDLTGDTSGTIPDPTPTVINVPDNAASVSEEVRPFWTPGGGATCLNPTHVIDGNGGSQHSCPLPASGGNNTHSYQENKSSTPCTPFDYSAVNTLDLWSARMAHEYSVPGGFMQSNREFTQPLRDFYDHDANSFTNRNFGHKLMMGVVETKISEVEGLQTLLVVNQHYASIEVVNAVSKIVDALIENSIVTNSPFVKYPKDKAEQYKRDYPEFTKFLQNEIPKIANNARIIQEIHDLTDTPKDTIKAHLQWGKGPEIVIAQLGGEGENERYGRYLGHVLEEEKNILYIDIDLVNDIDNLKNNAEFRNEIGFLIAVTILHEYTHFGDTNYGNNFWSNEFFEERLEENEAGILFEKAVFEGEKVWRTNVGIIYRKFKL